MRKLKLPIVEALLALGRDGHPGVPTSLADRETGWRSLMNGDEPWTAWAATANDKDLRLRLRGLVLFSSASGCSRGSVSPVIPLYREFLRRDPQDEPAVTGWIVDHRRNDYEPFGTIMHGGARTQAELRAYRDRRAQARAAGLARDEERQKRDGEAKAARATTQLPAAVRRGDVKAVKALLHAGAKLSALPSGHLVAIAKENGREAMIAFLAELGVDDAQNAAQ